MLSMKFRCMLCTVRMTSVQEMSLGNGFDKKVHDIVETRTLSFVLEVSLFHSIICIGVQCSLMSSNMIAAFRY